MRPECVCCGAPLSGGTSTPTRVIQVLCPQCIREIRELQIQTSRPSAGEVGAQES